MIPLYRCPEIKSKASRISADNGVICCNSVFVQKPASLVMRIGQVQYWISDIAHCNIDCAKVGALLVDNLEKEQPVS